MRLGSCSFFCFFFQAEDGIRDRNVTGVQTCALPISPVLQSRIESVRQFRLASRKQATQESAATPALFQERRQPEVPRSEERRVGKECRSRWSAAEEKKKQKTARGGQGTKRYEEDEWV